MKVKLITLGCPKNLVDSEHLHGGLLARGVEFTDEAAEAQAIIINTCGFIESAKEESIETILDAVAMKEEGTVEKVIVTGCLSQRYGEELRSEIPEIDALYGNRDLNSIVSSMARDLRARRELHGERHLLTPKHYAYLKISEGCEHPCTFCAIPGIRGGFRSTPVPELVTQAQKLAEQSVRELVLIAQDSTQYGLDLDGSQQLPALLRALAQVDGIEWLRLMYAYPWHMTDEIIAALAETEKVCAYLDMPVQHTSNRILKRMARRITAEKQHAVIEKLRARIPGLTLRTSLIVGFPGESEQEFAELYDYVADGHFDRLGVFTYSAEENTPAARFEDDVPEPVKRERQDLLIQAQADSLEEKNQAFLGRRVRVLIDEYDPAAGVFRGRSEGDCPEIDNTVLVRGVCRVGAFYDVELCRAGAYELEGEVVAAEPSASPAGGTLHIPVIPNGT